jgi:F-type H+-transporting ATPase subunit delta
MTVSGGFAVVQPDSQLSINAVEGFPLEDFSADVSALGCKTYKKKVI